MKMNNKGQSLVLFVLMIPVLLLVFWGVYTVGRISLLQQELDSINDLVIDYGIDKMAEPDTSDKLRKIIIKNKDDIDKIEININDSRIKIILEDTVDTRVSLLNHVFTVRSVYTGYIDGEQKVIERDK